MKFKTGDIFYWRGTFYITKYKILGITGERYHLGIINPNSDFLEMDCGLIPYISIDGIPGIYSSLEDVPPLDFLIDAVQVSSVNPRRKEARCIN